ncbi:UNVERIFIED_CONTAM: hypothetical protein P3C96_18370 [Pseudomonas aeruginosa]
MKELNDIEVTCVSGGTLSGMIVGAVDGAATGMAIGGKWGGAGGFGFGALSQLVGLIVPTAMGAIAGGTVGLFTNAETNRHGCYCRGHGRSLHQCRDGCRLLGPIPGKLRSR